MGARGVTPHIISSWRGLNTFISETNVDEQSWIDSDNVLVNAKGEAEVIRSPKAFTGVIPSGPLAIVSMDEYQRAIGNLLIVDHGTRTDQVGSGGVITNIRTGNNGAAWVSLSVKDTLQRIDSHEFIQLLNDGVTFYRNGIDPPAAAPTISYTANGADE
jgi:hypothetical protein